MLHAVCAYAQTAPPAQTCTTDAEGALIEANRFEEALSARRARLAQLPPPVDARSRSVSVCMRTQEGMLLARLERPNEALEILKPLLTEAQTTLGPNHPATLDVELGLSRAYAAAGDRGAEIKMLQALLPRASKVYGSNSLQLQTVVRNLANAYHWTGNFVDALALDRQVLAMSLANCKTGAHCPAQIARARSQLADTLRRMKQFAEALPLAEEAVDALTVASGATHPSTLDARLTVASIHSEAGRPAQAAQMNREIYETARQHLGESHTLTRKARGNLAVVVDATGNLAESIEMEKQQLAAVKAARGPLHPETLLTLTNLSERLLRDRRFSEALPLLEEAVVAMLTNRAQIAFDDRLTLAWQSDSRRTVDAYLIALMRNGRVADAFLTAELFKSQLLADRMALDGTESGLSETDAAAFRKLRLSLGMVEQTVAIKRELRQPTLADDVRRSDLQQKLAVYRSTKGHAGTELPRATRPPDWYMAMHANERDSARISYVFIAGIAGAFVDLGGKVEYVSLGTRRDIVDAIEAYRLMMRSRAAAVQSLAVTVWKRPQGGYVVGASPGDGAQEEKNPEPVAQYLAEKLLKPLARHLEGKTRILVSADQFIAHVPFDSLKVDGKRLGDTAEITLIPSFSLYATLTQRKQSYAASPRTAFLGFGGAPYQRVVALAPNITYLRERPGAMRPMDMAIVAQQVRKDPAKLLHAFAGLAFGMPELPGSRSEVEAIARLFPASETVLMTGDNATEENLYRLADEGKLGRFRAIHFAAHGFLSDTEPALSAVVLSQIKRSAGTDGYVTMPELAALGLRSDLVVLSACDSGVGKAQTGEGLLGLSYALFQAGTVASLVTLWPIPDKEIVPVMKRFYEEWTQGASTATALARTKRWALKNGVAATAVDAFVLFGL